MKKLDPKQYIIIQGAKAHNLKNIDVHIPRNQLTVVTGLSGSGKSSLVFDTLFAAAHRMYAETLDTYVRQFVGKMTNPSVTSMKGLSPAIAIKQHFSGSHSQSTLGMITELCDYLSILYAHIAITYSPVSGKTVKKHTITDVVDFVQQQEGGTKVIITYPMVVDEQACFMEQLSIAQSKGITRLVQEGNIYFIDEICAQKNMGFDVKKPFYGLIDRLVVGDNQGEQPQDRISDSVQMAFIQGKGRVAIHLVNHGIHHFSDKFELDGIKFEWPTPSFFRFNTPYGCCKMCSGVGHVTIIDENKVIPHPEYSIADGAIAPWRGPTMRKWLHPILHHQDAFPIHMPYSILNVDQKAFLWKGSGNFEGIDRFFDWCSTQTHKIQYRVLLARYRSKIPCKSCQGSRLRSDAHYAKINHHTITDLFCMSIDRLSDWLDDLSLSTQERALTRTIFTEIKNRVDHLKRVGLGYLQLSRSVSSLSTGEYQRARIASALSSPLVGTIYILDEPTTGLHPRDVSCLLEVLLDLKKQGSTVVLVEHEPSVIYAADHIIEIGPKAGAKGGELVFQGDIKGLLEDGQSYTAKYLKGVLKIPMPKYRRAWRRSICISNIMVHPLQHISVEIPLGVFTVITGVSGVGKSSLVRRVIYPLVEGWIKGQNRDSGLGCMQQKLAQVTGDLDAIHGIQLINQQPIGRSSRSNPATYLNIYDHIRSIFVQADLSIKRHYQMGHFSFNAEEGRCIDCSGEGVEKIEMQFMSDLVLPCEKCKGKRFKPEILDVTYYGKNIASILDMTIDEAGFFFKNHESILKKIKTLQRVGLGYVQLGQPSNSLSGGEAQRLKLAYYLDQELDGHQRPSLYIFDEPTTGLHMHDTRKLLPAMQALVERGHTILVIEHNLEVIKVADWVIDLDGQGPSNNTQVAFKGHPEQLAQLEDNQTAFYLKRSMHEPIYP